MTKSPAIRRHKTRCLPVSPSRLPPAILAALRFPSQVCLRLSSLRSGSRPGRPAAAFTLIEMLIVIAIIAMLTALTLPALQGLFGIAGRRGGANVLAGAMEQARLAALQHGVSAYVGFPTSLADKETGFNSVIIFRETRADERMSNNAPLYSVLSRWLRYPQGVFVDPGTVPTAALTVTNLPRLGTNRVTSVNLVQFDRYGKLKPETPLEVRIGEGTVDSSTVNFRGGAKNYTALKVLPLTGRVKITDGVLDQ
jgi:prepilin-type N-terminal cleavage/methylation domain-containing protein